ncbi:MAG: putative TIM-barrel enzyme, partial [Cognaticolwellia sp.]
MLKNIQTTLTLLAAKRGMNMSNLTIRKTHKFGLLAAAVMAASAPTYVQSAEFLDGLAEVNFLALQNYQAIQAKEGAFRPVDEEQSSGFGRIRVNLQFKFHINEYIVADVDIAEE